MVKIQEAKVLSAARDQASKARLLVADAPHSRAFRISVALCLGALVFTPHDCLCDAAVMASWRPGLSRKSADQLSRHSAVNDLIKRTLASAAIPCHHYFYEMTTGNPMAN